MIVSYTQRLLSTRSNLGVGGFIKCPIRVIRDRGKPEPSLAMSAMQPEEEVDSRYKRLRDGPLGIDGWFRIYIPSRSIGRGRGPSHPQARAPSATAIPR